MAHEVKLYAVLDPEGRLVVATDGNRKSLWILQQFGFVGDDDQANIALEEAGYERLGPWDATEADWFAPVAKKVEA